MPEQYRSFALTVRPQLGLTDETLAALNKYAESQDHAYAVVEKEGHEKHWHAQFWYDKAKPRGRVAEAIARICQRTIPDWSKPQLKVLRNGVRIAYSDWHLSYLEHNEDKESANVQVENAPLDTSPFYPTEDEQAALQAKVNAADPEYHKLATMYAEDCPDVVKPTERQVALWLAKKQLTEKSISITRQKRDRLQKTRLLWLYILGEDADEEDLLLEYYSAPAPSVVRQNLLSALDIHAVSSEDDPVAKESSTRWNSPESETRSLSEKGWSPSDESSGD